MVHDRLRCRPLVSRKIESKPPKRERVMTLQTKKKTTLLLVLAQRTCFRGAFLIKFKFFGENYQQVSFENESIHRTL